VKATICEMSKIAHPNRITSVQSRSMSKTAHLMSLTRRRPRSQPERWRVNWSTDGSSLAEAIVAKLLADEVLARDVYNKLHSKVINERQKKRRSVARNEDVGDRAKKGLATRPASLPLSR
jgi:hypothetical protein